MATIIRFVRGESSTAPASCVHDAPRAVITPLGKKPVAAPAAPVPTAPAPAPQAEAYRTDMLAKLHIRLSKLYKKLEHFNRAMYEACLLERYGTDSAANLTPEQLHDALRWLAKLEFTAIGSRRAANAEAYAGTAHQLKMTRIGELLEAEARVKGGKPRWARAVNILKSVTQNTVKSLAKATPDQLDSVISALCRATKSPAMKPPRRAL